MKEYQTPELEIVVFDAADVIATSDPSVMNTPSLDIDYFDEI